MNDERTKLGLAFAARLHEAMCDPIYGLREDLNLTEQAAELKLSKSLLSKWLSGGTAKPDYQIIRPVCSRLKVRPESLRDNEGPKRIDTTTKGVATPQQMRDWILGMKLEQQKQFVCDLLDDVGKNFRAKWIEAMVRAALDEGFIDRMPDILVSEKLADQTLEAAKRRKEHPLRSAEPE